jgi:hypothetical protein
MKTLFILLGLAALVSLGQARLFKREVRYNDQGVKYFYDPDTGKSYYTGLILPPDVSTEKTYYTGLIPPPDVKVDRTYYTGLVQPPEVDYSKTYYTGLIQPPEVDYSKTYYTGLIQPQEVDYSKTYYTGLIPPPEVDYSKTYYTGLIPPPEVQVQHQSSGGTLNLLTKPLDAAANIIDKTGNVANKVISLPFDAAREVVGGVGLDNTILGKVAGGVLDLGEGIEHTKMNLLSGVAQAPFRLASSILHKEEKKEKRSVQSVAAQCCANSGLISSIQQEVSLLRASVNGFDQRLNGLIAKLSQI